MRTATTIAITILLATPMAASLQIRAPPTPVEYDPTDAELMLTLARLDRPGLEPLPWPAADPGATLPDILQRIAARAGQPMSPEDAAQFAALNPRVSAPLVTLFLAIESSWDAYDLATADLSADEMAELWALHQQGLDQSARGQALVAQVDQETLLAAAIMLTDVTESVVVPQLQAAANQNIWPGNGLWDPVGVLRLGSPRDDIERTNRIVQIDPRGTDQYYNNAGGAMTLDPLTGDGLIPSPFAISIDLSGNDHYESHRINSAQGASSLGLGFGILLDLSGADDYSCFAECLGEGIGLMRDFNGNDEYLIGEFAMGYGFPLGIARDDRGNDYYRLNIQTAGMSHVDNMTGLLWDRAGTDQYATYGRSDRRLGWGEDGGRGWFVDEGPEIDTYETSFVGSPINWHGCNDCTWERGGTPTGEGNDNHGGLSHLITRQDPTVRQLP